MSDGAYAVPKPDPRVVVLTGDRGAGKTTLCRQVAASASAAGWHVAGVLSPAIFDNGLKVGIAIADLHGGHSRSLASKVEKVEPGAMAYRFDDEALAWANATLATAVPCDLLIIDELGPLEMDLGRGLLSAFAVLRRGEYRLALVVVRPELVERFLARLGLAGHVMTVPQLAACLADSATFAQFLSASGSHA